MEGPLAVVGADPVFGESDPPRELLRGVSKEVLTCVTSHSRKDCQIVMYDGLKSLVDLYVEGGKRGASLTLALRPSFGFLAVRVASQVVNTKKFYLRVMSCMLLPSRIRGSLRKGGSGESAFLLQYRLNGCPLHSTWPFREHCLVHVVTLATH